MGPENDNSLGLKNDIFSKRTSTTKIVKERKWFYHSSNLISRSIS